MSQSVIRISREEVLALLNGQSVQRWPCFSGLINVTVPGLESLELHLSEVHADPVKMANAAATTYRLFGFESAVVPLNMCVEAGVLGAPVDYRQDAPFAEFPKVSEPLAASVDDLILNIPSDPTCHERVSIVLEVIRLLKAEVGEEIVVGGWVPGPFTLATLLVEPGKLITETKTAPESVSRVLDPLTDMLAEVALGYRAAGADFITVHEMGGSPGFIGPPAFENLVLPRLQRLLAALPSPRVLSVCGYTNHSMSLLVAVGADALSVDQTNDLSQSRETLGPEAILFGNIDPVGTLTEGDETGVRNAVAQAIESGVDAVWPGCDLLPQLPAVNLQAMVDEAQRYRKGTGSG